MNGVNLKTIQVLLGHKTITMTARYAHLAARHLKAAVESIVPPWWKKVPVIGYLMFWDWRGAMHCRS
jgi:hypothetical protein